MKYCKQLLILCTVLSIISCSIPQTDTDVKSSVSKLQNRKRQYVKKRVIPKVKVKLFVFDFFNNTPYGGEKLGMTAADDLRSKLRSYNTMVVLGPADIPKLQDLNPSQIDIDEAIEILKTYDIRAFGYGSIDYLKLRRNQGKVGVFREEEISLETKISVRFVEVNSGNVLLEKSYEENDKKERTVIFDSKQKLYDEVFAMNVISKISSKIVPGLERSITRLVWSGRIAKISDGKVYINAGIRSGIEIGDFMRIIEPGEEVIDPQSGEIIGMAPGRVKGTVEITHYFGKDGSVASIHTGGGFKIGDKVVLY